MGDRRQFLRGGVAAAGCAVLAPLWARKARAAASLRLVPLTGRLSLIQGAAANIVVASAGKELMLVDGGAAADAEALLHLLDQHYPGQKLKAVFNTHWHWDQSGFNATARARGVDVFAHENTRLWLSTTVNSRWEHKIYKPQPAAALPNRTFYYDPQQYEFGGTKVEYVHLDAAHTDGDIYVRFPEENVIAVGGVLSPGRYPIIDDATNGWLGGINGALYALNEVGDEATRLVPATGPVAGMADLKLQMDMGVDVMTQMGEVYRKGGTFEDFVALKPTSKYDAQFGDPAQFLQQAFDSAWYQVSSFGGLSTGLPRSRGGFGPPPARGKAK